MKKLCLSIISSLFCPHKCLRNVHTEWLGYGQNNSKTYEQINETICCFTRHLGLLVNPMATITIKLTPEMAKEMLPIWARQRAQKASELEELDAKIQEVKSALKVPTPETNGASVQTVPLKTPEGRNKRGESAKRISHLLETKNGQGATIKGIMEELGTTYGTTRRVLHDLKKEKRVRARGGMWKWKASGS
jgi:hypothetical protein